MKTIYFIILKLIDLFLLFFIIALFFYPIEKVQSDNSVYFENCFFSCENVFNLFLINFVCIIVCIILIVLFEYKIFNTKQID